MLRILPRPSFVGGLSSSPRSGTERAKHSLRRVVSIEANFFNAFTRRITMSAKHDDKQKHSKQPVTAQPKSAVAADEPATKGQDTRRDRTGGQNSSVDEKRNDEQQYHAGGAAHDPHKRTQEQLASNDPDAGDVEKETRDENAPFNKTYGGHE
jgi:hypothetical protein